MLTSCEFNSQQYLDSRLQAELKLLDAAANASYRDRNVYCTKRSIAADLAFEPLKHLLHANLKTKILEIGCGDGNAIKKILVDHPKILSKNITATSLNPLPEHQDLVDLGVDLKTKIIAEDLPNTWKNSFDLVIASVVLQWTNTDLSIPQIINTLTNDGIFLGFDSRPVVAQIEEVAQKSEMIDILTPNKNSIGKTIVTV